MLDHRHRVPVVLEDVRDGFPAGPIRECTVHQDHVLDAGLGRRRGNIQSLLQQQSCARQRRSERRNPVNLFHDYSPLNFHLQRNIQVRWPSCGRRLFSQLGAPPNHRNRLNSYLGSAAQALPLEWDPDDCCQLGLPWVELFISNLIA